MAAKSSTENRIGCRFCDWTTPKWRRLKDNTLSGPSKAYGRLFSHVESEHPVEWREVVKALDSIAEEAEARERSVRI